MAVWLFRLFAAFIGSVVLWSDSSSAIKVTDLSFSNKTRDGFTVAWGYQLDGHDEAELLGFQLTVSNVFIIEVARYELDANRTQWTVDGVDSGTVFLVCVAARLADVAAEPSGQLTAANGTCDSVATSYDPWNVRGEVACYIGVAIFLVFVALMVYDLAYPRGPPEAHTVHKAATEKEKPENPDNLPLSTIELSDNMY